MRASTMKEIIRFNVYTVYSTATVYTTLTQHAYSNTFPIFVYYNFRACFFYSRYFRSNGVIHSFIRRGAGEIFPTKCRIYSARRLNDERGESEYQREKEIGSMALVLCAYFQSTYERARKINRRFRTCCM